MDNNGSRVVWEVRCVKDGSGSSDQVFFVLGRDSVSMGHCPNFTKKVSAKGAKSGSACPSIRGGYRKGGNGCHEVEQGRVASGRGYTT